MTSTTSCRPSGMLTIMSGRNAPSSPATCTCSTKSQCSTMPASSASRRSVISPHWPRTSGRRSAVTRLRVSRCSACCPSATPSSEARSDPNASARSFSMRAICSCVRASASRTGASSEATDFSRSARSRAREFLLLPERLPGELQEHLAVAAQRRAGDGVEPGPQALAGVEFGARLRQLDLERVRAPARRPASPPRMRSGPAARAAGAGPGIRSCQGACARRRVGGHPVEQFLRGRDDAVRLPAHAGRPARER